MIFRILYVALLLPILANAQTPRQVPFMVRVVPVFHGENIRLGQIVSVEQGDTLVLHTLRFYLGHFRWMQKGEVVFSDSRYCLLDLEQDSTLALTFRIPENLTFDHLEFTLGVDSLTTVSGAMGGDLDPTEGMFWAWQSGYIHVKIEGTSSNCPVKNHAFAFHLGGYLPPFSTVHQVLLPGLPGGSVVIGFDLAPFFGQVNWNKKGGIMSPCAEAVRLSGVLAQSFRLYE